jgi:hypothetical protein
VPLAMAASGGGHFLWLTLCYWVAAPIVHRNALRLSESGAQGQLA